MASPRNRAVLGATILLLQVFVQLRGVVALCSTECTTEDSDPSFYYSVSLDCNLPNVSAILDIKNYGVPFRIRELHLECQYSLTNRESCTPVFEDNWDERWSNERQIIPLNTSLLQECHLVGCFKYTSTSVYPFRGDNLACSVTGVVVDFEQTHMLATEGRNISICVRVKGDAGLPVDVDIQLINSSISSVLEYSRGRNFTENLQHQCFEIVMSANDRVFRDDMMMEFGLVILPNVETVKPGRNRTIVVDILDKDVFIEFEKKETLITEGQNISICVLIHSQMDATHKVNISLLNGSKSLNSNIIIGDMNIVPSDDKFIKKCREIVVQNNSAFHNKKTLVFALEVQKEEEVLLGQRISTVYLQDNDAELSFNGDYIISIDGNQSSTGTELSIYGGNTTTRIDDNKIFIGTQVFEISMVASVSFALVILVGLSLILRHCHKKRSRASLIHYNLKPPHFQGNSEYDEKFLFGKSLLTFQRSHSCITTIDILAKSSCETAEEEHSKKQNIFSEENIQVDSSNTSGYSSARQKFHSNTSSDDFVVAHEEENNKCMPHPNDSETNGGEIKSFLNNLTTLDNTISLGCDCNEISLSDCGTANLPTPDSSKEENPWKPLPNKHPTVPCVVDSTMALSDTDYVSDESFNSRNMPSDVVVPKSSSNSQLEGNYLHNDKELPSESVQLDNNRPKEYFNFHSSYLNLYEGKEDDSSYRMQASSSDGYVECSASSTTWPNNEYIRDTNTGSSNNSVDLDRSLQTSYNEDFVVSEILPSIVSISSPS